jgi:hypothetical protein
MLEHHKQMQRLAHTTLCRWQQSSVPLLEGGSSRGRLDCCLYVSMVMSHCDSNYLVQVWSRLRRLAPVLLSISLVPFCKYLLNACMHNSLHA